METAHGKNAGRVEVIDANEGHLSQLASLFDAYRQFYGQAEDIAGALRFLRERWAARDSKIFIAEHHQNGRKTAVGFIQLYPSFSSVSMRRLWILNDLFVDPQVRRHGAGSALLQRAESWALETGAKGLVLATAVENLTAQALYVHRKWRRDEQFFHYYFYV